jgi:uncharacterized LabA/DUF88 family protein
MSKGNVSILWDVENVTPSTDSLFVDGLMEHAESFGRVVSARAYCDWSKPDYRKLGPQLSRLHFYLVHVPRAKGQKNSADMSLISDTLELLGLYTHVETFILVTGDSDFRPLVLALRRAGKSVHIVCDVRKASDELLGMAESFVDYRELVPGGDAEEEAEEGPTPSRDGRPTGGGTTQVPRERWYELLAETAAIMVGEEKSTNFGAVKTRFRMLNPDFDERALGFRRWSDFVTDAARASFVRIVEVDEQALITPIEGSKVAESAQQEAFESLLDLLRELDGGKDPQFQDYAVLNTRLNDRKVDYRSLGYRRLKAFVQAAEARGLVESKSEGIRRYVRRVVQSAPRGSHRGKRGKR